ncbi:hypothetical protein U9M48_032200 [Paspalum notatum var. saurae]|uniref:Uncharacterized protein n=1 Tax=Paspalum notatum var. saurae TaxID=547442 RepID=A0AAQ3U507_PASNO
MAEARAVALARGTGPEEAPLDASAIRSRVEQLSLKRRRGEGEESEVADAEVALGLDLEYKVFQEVEDEWDSSTAEVPSDCLDAYLEQLRKDVASAEEANRRVSDEIGVTAETTFDCAYMVQLDADIELLESLFSKLDSKALKHLDGNPVLGLSDSTEPCRNQSIAEDYVYEVLKLDHQIGKNKMDLEILQNLESLKFTVIWIDEFLSDIPNPLSSDDEMCKLKSMLLPFGAKIYFEDNCLRMFLKALPVTSDCVLSQDVPVHSFISDHELLIEVYERNMEPKKVQISPDDLSVDILIERLKSSRETISSPALEWLLQQCQRHFIINALRLSLVNDANNSRHSFEYFDKEEMILAHLDRGIDASIKISSDWPLCSYGLKLISICNSGTHPANITSTLLSKTKELANGLELQIRQHLVRFIDAVEEILIRELRSG